MQLKRHKSSKLPGIMTMAMAMITRNKKHTQFTVTLEYFFTFTLKIWVNGSYLNLLIRNL